MTTKQVTTKTEPEVLPQVYECLLPETSAKAAKILKENLGAGGINENDLTRIKIPAGGGLTWAVPSFKGDEAVKSIEGIIIYFKDVRGYWPEVYSGANDPPACSSIDGLTGLGNPGGDCTPCPMNQFGSGKDNVGKPNDSKACGESRLLFMLREHDLIPIIIRLSTMSIKPCRNYFMNLTQKQIPYYGAITSISLKNEKNKGGIVYSQAAFQGLNVLEDKDIIQVSKTIEALGAIFQKETIIEADVKYEA